MSAMSDKRLESILKIRTTNIQPQFDTILAEKHLMSHLSFFKYLQFIKYYLLKLS